MRFSHYTKSELNLLEIFGIVSNRNKNRGFQKIYRYMYIETEIVPQKLIPFEIKIFDSQKQNRCPAK